MISAGKNVPQLMNAIIEIPENGFVKYEFDKEAGLLAVDRLLSTPVRYPANYGYFPSTLGEDGDPLDCLVLCSEQISPCTLIEVRPIGVFLMEDKGDKDEKIVCVPKEKIDPIYKNITSLEDLPEITKKRIEFFFAHYKDLENGNVKVLGWGDLNMAYNIINRSIEKYKG